jgi:hypothetical protein
MKAALFLCIFSGVTSLALASDKKDEYQLVPIEAKPTTELQPCQSKYMSLAPATSIRSLMPTEPGQVRNVGHVELNQWVTDVTRERSFYALIEHKGHFLGIDPKTNFEKDSQVLFFATRNDPIVGRVPKRGYHLSVDVDGNSEEGFTQSGRIMRMMQRWQKKQHSEDPRWIKVGSDDYYPFLKSTDTPEMKSFLDSLLGKYVSGFNEMTNESGSTKYSIYTGWVRKIFSMKTPSTIGRTGEMIYAEVESLDGKVSTVLLTPGKGPSGDLYVYNYKYPGLVADARKDHFDAKKANAKSDREKLRAAPILQGKDPQWAGKVIDFYSPDFLQLLHQGHSIVERIPKLTRRGGSLRLGPHHVAFFLLRREHIHQLVAGDIVWNMRTHRYYVVGQDKIPEKLVYKLESEFKDGLGVFIDSSKGLPTLPSSRKPSQISQ